MITLATSIIARRRRSIAAVWAVACV